VEPNPQVVMIRQWERQHDAIHDRHGLPSGVGPQTEHELLATGFRFLASSDCSSSLTTAVRHFVRLTVRGLLGVPGWLEARQASWSSRQS
jgi:hypothetical protein